MSATSLANSNCELLNTKERLIYHLIRTVTAGQKGESGDEEYEALKYLKDLGYPRDGHRWKFMMESGEPGTHIKPTAGGRTLFRAEEIEGALFGMLATLNTAIQGGQISNFEQLKRAISHAGKALG